MRPSALSKAEEGIGAVSDGNRQRERQKEETRQRVYEAALAVFRAEGAEAARVDDIAARAGVSRGTFYFHFPSKDDVLRERMTRSQLEVVGSLEALSIEEPIRRVLGHVADAIAHQWRDEPRLLADIGMVALKTTADALSDTARMHPLQRALVPYFERASQRGEVGALIPPDLSSQFFLVNLFGAALAWTGNPVLPLPDLLENVVTFFLKAARP